MEEVHRSIGRIEGKMDGLDDKITIVLDLLSKQNGRLSKVEKKVWWFSGIGTTVGVIAGYIFGK